jgi:hypothetical protein
LLYFVEPKPTAMYKVYRYEDENGVGPYQSCIDEEFGYLLSKAHCNNPRTPNPFKDKIEDFYYSITKTGRCLFGCDSIKLLKRWFRGFNRTLKRKNFVIVEYVVPNKFSSISGKQCVFDKAQYIERNVIE